MDNQDNATTQDDVQRELLDAQRRSEEVPTSRSDSAGSTRTDNRAEPNGNGFIQDSPFGSHLGDQTTAPPPPENAGNLGGPSVSAAENGTTASPTGVQPHSQVGNNGIFSNQHIHTYSSLLQNSSGALNFPAGLVTSSTASMTGYSSGNPPPVQHMTQVGPRIFPPHVSLSSGARQIGTTAIFENSSAPAMAPRSFPPASASNVASSLALLPGSQSGQASSSAVSFPFTESAAPPAPFSLAPVLNSQTNAPAIFSNAGAAATGSLAQVPSATASNASGIYLVPQTSAPSAWSSLSAPPSSTRGPPFLQTRNEQLIAYTASSQPGTCESQNTQCAAAPTANTAETSRAYTHFDPLTVPQHATGDLLGLPQQFQDQRYQRRVEIKISPFWTSRASVWFRMLEMQFTKNGVIADDMKLSHLVANLPEQVVLVIEHVLSNLPNTEQYEAVKQALLAHYAESQEDKYRKMATQCHLGSRRPSEFLLELRSLGGNNMDPNYVKTLWLDKMPRELQLSLEPVRNLPDRELMQLADRLIGLQQTATHNQIQQTTTHNQIDVVQARAPQAPTPPEHLAQRVDLLAEQLTSLIKEFRQFRSQSRGRSSSRNRSRNNREASTSPDRRRERSPLPNNRAEARTRDDRGYCWYHRRFGRKADKCEDPCTWTGSEN